MTHVAVVGAWRTRAIFFATGLLFIGMVTVSFFSAHLTTLLSAKVHVHEPRPVLNVLISMVDGDTVYTINGARAFTFKEDASFSPPKGANDYMKAYPLEGSTLVCQAAQLLLLSLTSAHHFTGVQRSHQWILHPRYQWHRSSSLHSNRSQSRIQRFVRTCGVVRHRFCNFPRVRLLQPSTRPWLLLDLLAVSKRHAAI
jgi:hypothetical protein